MLFSHIFYSLGVSLFPSLSLPLSLSCTGTQYTPGTNLTIRAYDETVSEFIIPVTDQNGFTAVRLLRIYNKRFDFPCLKDFENLNGSLRLCEGIEEGTLQPTAHLSGKAPEIQTLTETDILQKNQQLIFNFTTSLLLNFSSFALSNKKHTNHITTKPLPSRPSQRTIGIFNYGLHLQENTSWILSPMSLALLEVAKMARLQASLHSDEDLYFFRETSSQAFSFSRGKLKSVNLMVKLALLVREWDQSGNKTILCFMF